MRFVRTALEDSARVSGAPVARSSSLPEWSNPSAVVSLFFDCIGQELP
jgi:hypothetical protein